MTAAEKKVIIEMIPIQDLDNGDMLFVRYSGEATIDNICQNIEIIRNWLGSHNREVMVVAIIGNLRCHYKLGL